MTEEITVEVIPTKHKAVDPNAPLVRVENLEVTFVTGMGDVQALRDRLLMFRAIGEEFRVLREKLFAGFDALIAARPVFLEPVEDFRHLQAALRAYPVA